MKQPVKQQAGRNKEVSATALATPVNQGGGSDGKQSATPQKKATFK
jgi:hypothetical protein